MFYDKVFSHMITHFCTQVLGIIQYAQKTRSWRGVVAMWKVTHLGDFFKLLLLFIISNGIAYRKKKKKRWSFSKKKIGLMNDWSSHGTRDPSLIHMSARFLYNAELFKLKSWQQATNCAFLNSLTSVQGRRGRYGRDQSIHSCSVWEFVLGSAG